MICNGRSAVAIAGYLSDSVMNNIVDQKGLAPVVKAERKDALKNVHFSNICARMV